MVVLVCAFQLRHVLSTLLLHNALSPSHLDALWAVTEKEDQIQAVSHFLRIFVLLTCWYDQLGRRLLLGVGPKSGFCVVFSFSSSQLGLFSSAKNHCLEEYACCDALLTCLFLVTVRFGGFCCPGTWRELHSIMFQFAQEYADSFH